MVLVSKINEWWFLVALIAGVALAIAIAGLWISIKHMEIFDRGWQAGYRSGVAVTKEVPSVR